MPRHLSPVGCCLLLGVAMLGLAPPVSAQAPNVRMQKVLAQYVTTTGNRVLGLGSWISGKTFSAADSDFDMRLVMPKIGKEVGDKAAAEAQYLAQWRQAQGQLRAMIKEEFGAEAGAILKRTNLYAPGQLMAGVRDPADAIERFQQLKSVPNLGYTGPVNASTPVKYMEGMYGAGAPTYVQGYEKAAGRLFYSNGGQCVTGLSELAHLDEEAAVYSAAGSANTAGQWAEHCLTELNEGRGAKVAKYLERLEQDLTKSRSMSGLPLDEAYRKELTIMKETLRKQPWALAGQAEKVAALVARGRAEAAILGGFEKAGPMRQAYLRIMLDSVAVKSKLGELIAKVMEKTPSWVTAESTMNFLVYCAGTSAAAESLAKGDDVFQGMSSVCGAMNPFKSIGPLLLAEITAEIITQARLGGYDMAASFQGAWDLMEGIYSAWGRCDVDPDKRRKLTLADMVANFQVESKLEGVVMQQSIRASTRGLGTANEQADEGVALGIFNKCWPVIRDAWRWERDGIATEYLMLGSEIAHTPLIIYYKPNAPQPGKQFVCEATTDDRKLGDRLERMGQLLRMLYGKGSGVAVDYSWEPGGVSVGTRSALRGFTYDKAGTYPIKVWLRLTPYAKYTPTEPRIMRLREVPALVDVVVGDAPPQVVKPQTVKPVKRTATGEFHGIFELYACTLTFWDVGATLDEEHAKADLVVQGFGDNKQLLWTNTIPCRFSGAPDGKFTKQPDKNNAGEDVQSLLGACGIEGMVGGAKLILTFWLNGQAYGDRELALRWDPAP